jgi:hypothetical protein
MALAIEVIEAIAKLPAPELKIPDLASKQSSKKNVESAVLHLSDVQWGKVTSSYSSSIARQRLYELAVHVGKVIEARKHGARIEELHLLLGGDIVEGENIFPGQKHLIDAPVYAQAIHGASASIARLALRLLRHVDRIYIHCVGGNHGDDNKDSPTNWDEVCYEVAKRDLLGGSELFPERKKLTNRIIFGPIGNWFRVVRVLGWGNLLIHGHQLKGALGGTGFRTKVAGWIDAIPQSWDYLWLGHFHTMSSWVVNRRVVLINGTTESDNEYAQEDFAAVGIPSQRLGFFDEKYGLIADYPIYLTERNPNRK